MARNGDDYIHRIGRTGRAEQEGRAVSFIAAPDWNLMSGIERYLKITFEKIVMPGLTAEYQGPKKIKSSGKAASIKKRKPEAGKDKTKVAASKVKVRERDKKNIGKRRAPNAKPEADAQAAAPVIDGFAPLRKKPRQPIVDEE